jgi:glucose/arabinose dehydrogenase
MGGDELNSIVPGADFGWPHVTLGVNYTEPASDAKFWPGNPNQGRHDGYWMPTFAWMPSIAPSAIRTISGFHPRWDGDLLIATLAGQSLHRIRLDGSHVLYDERIAVDRRIRAIEIAHGRIYILFDDGRFGVAMPHVMADR